MILYHFPTSPFARRVRLTLAMKGLSAELRNPRENPEHAAELRRINPLHMVPVLVDGERTVLDSHAICAYLDHKVPSPPLYPSGLAAVEAFEYEAVVDSILGLLIDTGMRFAPIHGDPHFPAVREEMMKRAEGGLAFLARKVTERPRGPLCGEAWGYADIILLTFVTWLEGLPARAPTFAPAKSIVELGWTLPKELSTWADAHRQRSDFLAL